MSDIWTPKDVQRECQLESSRAAYSLMRKAGARQAGRSGRSLRISREAFLAWLDAKVKRPKVGE